MSRRRLRSLALLAVLAMERSRDETEPDADALDPAFLDQLAEDLRDMADVVEGLGERGG